MKIPKIFILLKQDAFEEATNLRNKTYETLAEQEKKLAEVRKTREMEIEDLRQVEILILFIFYSQIIIFNLKNFSAPKSQTYFKINISLNFELFY